MLGKPEGRRRRGRQRMRRLDGITSLTRWTWVWVSSGSWWRTGRPGVLQSMGLQIVGHDWATELRRAPWELIMILNTAGTKTPGWTNPCWFLTQRLEHRDSDDSSNQTHNGVAAEEEWTQFHLILIYYWEALTSGEFHLVSEDFF